MTVSYRLKLESDQWAHKIKPIGNFLANEFRQYNHEWVSYTSYHHIRSETVDVSWVNENVYSKCMFYFNVCLHSCKIYNAWCNVWWFIWLAVVGGLVISKANSIHINYLNILEWQLILAVFTKMRNINLMLVDYLTLCEYKYTALTNFNL